MDIDRELKWFEENLSPAEIHGRNIFHKLKNWNKLPSIQREQLLNVLEHYKSCKIENEKLKGYSENVLKKRVELLNIYKIQIEPVKFSPQTKFHSSVVEEFLFYLFRDLIEDLNGK